MKNNKYNQEYWENDFYQHVMEYVGMEDPNKRSRFYSKHLHDPLTYIVTENINRYDKLGKTKYREEYRRHLVEDCLAQIVMSLPKINVERFTALYEERPSCALSYCAQIVRCCMSNKSKKVWDKNHKLVSIELLDIEDYEQIKVS